MNFKNIAIKSATAVAAVAVVALFAVPSAYAAGGSAYGPYGPYGPYVPEPTFGSENLITYAAIALYTTGITIIAYSKFLKGKLLSPVKG